VNRTPLRRRSVDYRPTVGAVVTTWHPPRGAKKTRPRAAARDAQGRRNNQAEAFDAEPRMGARPVARAHERGGRTMLTWHLLRAAAIARHRVVWRACGGDPATWDLHMDMIRTVYGY
jgi:hypothetical protein